MMTERNMTRGAQIIKFERPRTFTSDEQAMEVVREAMFASGITYARMAAKVGVSHSTLANIASGRTRWPRPRTLFPLLDALGMRMQFVRRGRPGQ